MFKTMGYYTNYGLLTQIVVNAWRETSIYIRDSSSELGKFGRKVLSIFQATANKYLICFFQIIGKVSLNRPSRIPYQNDDKHFLDLQ